MFLDNFILIAQQVLVLFVLISVGFACGKFGVITEHASKKMTDIVLYIVTPCVMVNAFQREFTHELLGNVFIAAGVAVLILAGSIASPPASMTVPSSFLTLPGMILVRLVSSRWSVYSRR